MSTHRVPALVLAAVLIIAPLIYAQTAPDISLPAGDAVRGKALFESTKGNCLSCHRVNDNGSLYGPNLSAIGAPRGGGGGGGGRGAPAPAPANAPARGAAAPAVAPPLPAAAAPAAAGRGGVVPTMQDLAQSILDPNAVVSVQNRYVRLTMKDGKTIWGKLLSVDTFNVQIFDSSEKLQNVSKANMRDMTMASPMPSYKDKLTNQELSDVISYLMSLKGQ